MTAQVEGTGTLRVEWRDDRAVVTLNRPRERNAIDAAMG